MLHQSVCGRLGGTLDSGQGTSTLCGGVIWGAASGLGGSNRADLKAEKWCGDPETPER